MATQELRPLTLGELLDRCFTYYRKHFWVFVGIMAIPQVFVVAMQVLMQLIMRPMPSAQPGAGSPSAAVPSTSVLVGGVIGFLVMLVVYMMVYNVALGATTFAVSEAYLDRRTTVRGAYQKMRGLVWRLLVVPLAIMLRVFGCFILVGLAGAVAVGLGAALKGNWVGILIGVVIGLAGVVFGTVLAVRLFLGYSVAIPTLVLENAKATAALKRSYQLTKGFRDRVGWIISLMVILSWVVALVFQGPIFVASGILAAKQITAPYWLGFLADIAGGIGGALAGPLLMIALALFYYDLRVRKEGFDLQLMMAALDRPGSPAA